MNPARHLEVLTEELSAKLAVETLFGRFLPSTMDFHVLEFNGMENFFNRLPERLRAYQTWIPQDYRLLLLVDRDSDDCRKRKSRMETIAHEAGLATKTSPNPDGNFSLVSRLAIEELGAWFFGDMEAVRTAYPRVSKAVEQKEAYRDPDAVKGGTAEALLRVLQEAGYYKKQTRLPKLEVAQRISEQMEPDRNRSESFRTFWDATTRL